MIDGRQKMSKRSGWSVSMTRGLHLSVGFNTVFEKAQQQIMTMKAYLHHSVLVFFFEINSVLVAGSPGRVMGSDPTEWPIRASWAIGLSSDPVGMVSAGPLRSKSRRIGRVA